MVINAAFSLACLLLSCASLATSSHTTFGRFGVQKHAVSARSTALFGVPRGGGLFGNKDETKTSEAGGDDAGGGTQKETYPPLSTDEIEEWLEHVPVYAVTDSNGAGVVLKPENDTSVFYFFMSPAQANATLSQLKQGSTGEEMNLKVSAFSLGKIWFSLLNGESDQQATLKSPDGGDLSDKIKDVQYRLVPDTRDLLGARMLLTMSPEDGEKLKEGGGMTPEMAQAAIQKAMTESPKFKNTFNEIPVFTIAQMRMQKQPGDDETEPTTLLPMYLSMQNMIGTWQEFMKQAPSEVQGVEPAINLLSLHDLVDMMQKESEIDWRHVVLVPPAMGAAANGEGGAATPSVQDPMAQMGGATLGDE